MTFDEITKKYNCILCSESNKYSSLGKMFLADNEFYEGRYWYYENKDFIIDIHDLFIKKDYIETEVISIPQSISLISNYLISGSGEWLDPYQTLEPRSMFIVKNGYINEKYVLHGKSKFFMVGIKFKDSMIDQCVFKKTNIRKNDIIKIFLDIQNNITKPISKIADEILNCKMEGISAELFFEAKAKEWLSITLNAYEKRKKLPPLIESDKSSIERVAAYINDHYAFTISQQFLEKIAAVSGTKLKQLFKQMYNMSITEFTQRKRINAAENLLLTTDLEIRDIAKSVGYSSSSRFSTLFKRYKGIYPKDIRKYNDLL